MRTIIAWFMAASIMAVAYFGRHLDEINWHHEWVEFEYHYRGWSQGWMAQLRTFSTNEIMLLGAVVLVFVWSAVNINSK